MRVLAAIDDATRENLVLHATHSMTGQQVAEALERVATFRGYPTFQRSNNGPEFRCEAMAAWATKRNVTLVFIESFNGKLRERCLDLHVFEGLRHAQAILDAYRNEYNHEKPHGSLGMPPAAFATKLRRTINGKQLEDLLSICS